MNLADLLLTVALVLAAFGLGLGLGLLREVR